MILLFVVLMPFSAPLMGDYPSESLAKTFFDVNMLILGLLFLLNWHYASKDRRLIDSKISDENVTLMARRGTIIPVSPFWHCFCP